MLVWSSSLLNLSFEMILIANLQAAGRQAGDQWMTPHGGDWGGADGMVE